MTTAQHMSVSNLAWQLTDFASRVPGVAHAIAVSSDGLLLASSRGLSRDHADQLSAVASGMVSLTSGAARCFQGGGVIQAVLEMDKGFLFLMPIPGGSALAVIASRSCEIGLVGYEMAVLIDRSAEAFMTSPRHGADPAKGER